MKIENENGINVLVEAVHYAPCGRYKTLLCFGLRI